MAKFSVKSCCLSVITFGAAIVSFTHILAADEFVRLATNNTPQAFSNAKSNLSGFSAQMQINAMNSFNLPGLNVVQTNQAMVISGKETNNSDIVFSRMTLEYKGIPLTNRSEILSVSAPSGIFQQQSLIPFSVDGERASISQSQAENYALSQFQKETGEKGRIDNSELEVWVDDQKKGRLSWVTDIHAGTLSKPVKQRYWVSAVNRNETLNNENLIHSNDVFYKTSVWGYGAPENIKRDIGLPHLRVWIKDKNGEQQRTSTS